MIFFEGRFHAWAVYSVGNGHVAHEHNDESGDNDHFRDVSGLFPQLARHILSNCIAET